MAKTRTLVVRTAEQYRDSGLRTLRAGLIRRGVTSPNVDPGSDFYVEFQAIGNELAVVSAGVLVAADQVLPDTAVEEHLARWATIRNKSKSPGAGSVGNVVFNSSASSLVATGSQLIGPQGFRYEVTTGGTYADDDLIPVRALDTGGKTNLAAGTSLRWQTAPAFSSPIALVAPGGLVNGTDEEDDEDLRAKVLADIANPPNGENAAQLITDCEDSSPAVQKGFAYPAAQGAGTIHGAVTAVPTDTNKSREVASVTMSGTVVPYVSGQTTEHAYVVTTTVEDVDTTLSIGLNLPSAPSASPPGPGGGWLDGSPWPYVTGGAISRASVTAVTSSTVFTVDAQTAPVAGVARIAWLSPTDWTLYKATVLSSTGTAGAYVITLDAPFPNIAVGCLIWPQCENQQLYVDAILAAFRLMGPGEKTDNASSLQRAFRHPPTYESWPSSLGPHMLRSLEDAAPEIANSQFLYRSDGTTTVTGAEGLVEPQVPADIEDAPRIFVPEHVAFYRLI